MAKKRIVDDLIFENCRIAFRNFSGKEGKFNPPGRKNFCVMIDDRDFAERLKKDGWNIRELRPRDDQEQPQPYMQVTVSYDNIPPKVVLVTSKKQTILTDETIGMLDWAEIKNVDLVVRPYNWEVRGETGVKAYCKSMYVTIQEDVFADKYENLPMGGETAQIPAQFQEDDIPFD